MEVKFKDLSAWLKVAIIVAWIEGLIYGIAFIIGFIEGVV